MTETKTEQKTERCACTEAGQTMRRLAKMFEPPAAAREHFRQARIECLKGIRDLVEHRIEQLSQTEHKGTRITVE